MKVTHLFIKPQPGKKMRAVKSFSFSPGGIAENALCQPLRQVLIASKPITEECGLSAGDLRENVVVDWNGLYDLPSGAIIKIGGALIRLTFHCEPCKGLLGKIELKAIKHKRGVLGYFVNSGKITVGDALEVTRFSEEPIPYEIRERLRWYLQKQSYPVTATKLVYDLGLARSCLRALPALLRKIPDVNQGLVLYRADYSDDHSHHSHSV